jgi:hypothetical protein
MKRASSRKMAISAILFLPVAEDIPPERCSHLRRNRHFNPCLLVRSLTGHELCRLNQDLIRRFLGEVIAPLLA